MHTPLCKHASGDAAAYRSAAGRVGVPEICFADHVPSPDGYDPAHRMTVSQFPIYRRTILALQQNGSPDVLFGIEADYYEGCEDFLREWLPAQGFDLVLGSVHFIKDWGFDNPSERHVWDAVDVTGTWRAYFELVGKLVDTRLFDVIGHFDLPKKFGYRPPESAVNDMVRPVLDRIAERGMGIELNTAGLRKPVREIYPSPLILSLACERAIPICFGSDAHSPDEVGSGFPEALALARSVGYTHHFRIRGRKKVLEPLP
jgi:histidinol-phosphatase (PHP family)